MTCPAVLNAGEVHEAVCSRIMATLDAASVPFLVGGTFAFACYTREERRTKDLDIMLQRRHLEAAFGALEADGFNTSLPYPHWLAKATQGDLLVDLIFASGNGVARVDDDWFTHATTAELFGRQVLIAPPEEMIWSKAFVMERERYDGADVAHLLWSCGPRLDWARLERRFDTFLPVLAAHLQQFVFAFGDAFDRIPVRVFDRIQERSTELLKARAASRTCYGTLISREQYLCDLSRGYADGRLVEGTMAGEDVGIWTSAIPA